MSTTSQLHDKINEYASFITNTLQPQLQTAVEAKEATEKDLKEYLELRNKLQHLENMLNCEVTVGEKSKPIETLVDVAHQTIYCRAVISNPRTLYVDVGLGFMVELTIQEALTFIDKRVKFLEEEVLRHRTSVVEGIAKDVENALELLEELGAEIPVRD
jgi:prefoldin subunit 5